MTNNNDKNLSDILQQLKTGAILIKQKIDGRKHRRRFFLDEHENYISYDKSHRIFRQPRLYHIGDIDEIRTGFRAQTFGQLLKRGRIKATDENCAFTIMYDNHRKEVHLIAPNTRTRDLWAEGIQILVDRHAKADQRHLIKEENWILNYFRTADTDKSNSLSKKECQRLLADSLHVKVPDNIFEKLFQTADKSREGLLSPEEFVGFFNLLTQRKDLYEIMKKHVHNGDQQSIEQIHMTIDELLVFLHIVQNQIFEVNKRTDDDGDDNKFIIKYIETPKEAQDLIDEFELDIELKKKGLLGLDGFRNLLLSNNFNIMKPYYSQEIYQDMTRPLCDYYINTSHNTYLFYSQLTGDSNPEAYNRALLVGCRAVELDCHDGNNGKPIVTHAFTLVKPCLFESIIRYMEPNLFKTSPYPVILNIENHCSIGQQQEMARILREILGDRLLTKTLSDEDTTVLPSPEDLKYKVIVRSRKNKKVVKENSISQSEDNDHSSFDQITNDTSDDKTELFVYLKNAPYREYDYAKANYSSLHSSSLAEKTFDKIARETPSDLILQTTWRIIRTYPGGLRQDSSNANPINAWNYGVQMAALNYQNEDDIMPLCYGKFLDNGGCGYILKPNYLTNAMETKYNPLNSELKLDIPLTLTLTIISGQFLSRSNSTKSDIPDPYVVISVHGLPCDLAVHKTKVIQNNGFDPIWNEKFTFRVKYPQMALVYFSIYDYNAITADVRLSFFCLPLKTMQTGYRHIWLRDNKNDPTHSTLFVHVDIRNDSDDIASIRL